MKEILPLNRLESLVDAAGIATIGSVHAASASSLKAGPASQRTPKLHHHAADLVTHGGMALVVVNWGGVTVVTTSSAGGPGGGSGSGGGCGGTLGVSACLAASH